MKKILLTILFAVSGVATEGRAQQVVLKSNLLHTATATMNLGVEVGLAREWTLSIPANLNPWKWGDDKARFQHWGIQPEVRYWFCERFRRTFVGVHGHFADFNVGNWPHWGTASTNMQTNRYEGHLYGAGLSAGYSWMLRKRWSIEASVGMGYAHIVYDKYPCRACGSKLKEGHKNYFGPTQASVSLIYIIK